MEHISERGNTKSQAKILKNGIKWNRKQISPAIEIFLSLGVP